MFLDNCSRGAVGNDFPKGIIGITILTLDHSIGMPPLRETFLVGAILMTYPSIQTLSIRPSSILSPSRTTHGPTAE